jgi:hypothetical protein
MVERPEAMKTADTALPKSKGYKSRERVLDPGTGQARLGPEGGKG